MADLNNPFYRFYRFMSGKIEGIHGMREFDKHIVSWYGNEESKKSIVEAFPLGKSELIPPNYADKIIGVNHVAGTGGTFICQVISASPSLWGAEYSEKMLKSKEKDTLRWFLAFIDRWHPRVFRMHTDDVDIEDLHLWHKFVHISFELSPEEIKLLTTRLVHITNTRFNQAGRKYTNAVIRYHKILQNHLRTEFKQHFEFPFLHFYNKDKFINTSLKMFEYLELEPVDKETLKKMYLSWQDLNLRHYNNFIEAAKQIDIDQDTKDLT
jgi:hypothetical protein